MKEKEGFLYKESLVYNYSLKTDEIIDGTSLKMSADRATMKGAFLVERIRRKYFSTAHIRRGVPLF